MLSSHVNNLSVYIPVAGFLALILVGGLMWAFIQVREYLGIVFVKKEDCGDCVSREECKDCVNRTRQEFHDDINAKYDEIQQRLQRGHDEWSREIKSLKEESDKRNEVLIRIDTKVDLILNGQIGGKK